MKSQVTSTNTTGEVQESPVQSLQTFGHALGISPITLWRWRNKGWLQTVNIAGRQYITAVAKTEFLRRAEAGEFSKVHRSPFQKGVKR